MSDLDYDYRDENGVGRMLGWRPPSTEAGLMRAGATTFATWLDKNDLKMIPRSQWRQIDRRDVLDERFILDQQQCNGCVGFSAASMLMRLRALKGETYQKLSGSSVYAHVNGNRDEGACITDALYALENYGACLSDEFDYPKIYLRQMPGDAVETAKRFRLRFGLTLSSFDEMIVALHYGFLIQFPVNASNIQQYDSDGAIGFARGQGNHSVEADGCVRFADGSFGLDMPNTWGIWGPFKNGRAYVKERHVQGAASDQDAYASIDILVDPQDLDETKPQA